MFSRRLEWIVAGGLGAWAAARLAGADGVAWAEAWTVPWLAFTPQATAGAWVGALVMRDQGSRVTAGLAGVTLATAVLPRAIPRRQPDAAGPVLRVLTVNLLGGRAEAGALVGLVRTVKVDVLFVQDLDDEAAARLERAGLSDLLSWQHTRPVADRPRGGGIYARHPLAGEPEPRTGLASAAAEPGSGAGAGVGVESAAQCSARLRLPSGHGVRLVCVHAPPPKPWNATGAARWRGELGQLPGPGAVLTVLAGDFNATFDHLQLRRLLRRGYADAACQAGRGLTPTWGPRPSRPPALLTLDHVLVDPRCAVLTTSARRLAGSDHHALYAEIRLPAER